MFNYVLCELIKTFKYKFMSKDRIKQQRATNISSVLNLLRNNEIILTRIVKKLDKLDTQASVANKLTYRIEKKPN